MTDTLEAKTPLGWFKLTVQEIQTILGVSLLVVNCMIYYVLWIHALDARDYGKQTALDTKENNKEIAAALRESNKEFIKVLQELIQVTREQTCLLSLPQNRRPQDADICKKLSR